FATDQVGVTATTLPLASLPTAVNCCVAPMSRVTGFGVTTMVASGPAVTMAVAVAEMPPLCARIVLWNAPGVVPAVNRPVALMVPPPLVTVQVGVLAITLPKASVLVA